MLIVLSLTYQLNAFELSMILQMRKNQLRGYGKMLVLNTFSFRNKRNWLLVRKKKHYHQSCWVKSEKTFECRKL